MKGKDKVKKWVRDYLAHEAVKAEFDKRHPKGKRPDWLDLYMTTRSYEKKMEIISFRSYWNTGFC